MKSFYKLLFFIFLIAAFSINANIGKCQEKPEPSRGAGTELIPSSPDAMALGKYGLIPVSLYNGIPNISIALGNAEGREVNVPISLNYHNNGLKSYEKASSVGLGWSLNAGGIITRIIRDKVDELTNSSYKYDQTITKYSASDNVDLENIQAYLEGAMYFGTYDTEPDIYLYNFGKYSGSFFFYKGKVYQFPYSKLKITGSLSGPFTITTEDGDIYNFSTIETTAPKNSATSTYSIPNYVSSWYLTTIQPSDKKEIVNFTYSSANPIIMHGASTQTYMKSVSTNSILYQKTSSPSTTINTIQLTGISTSKMSVSINYQSDRRSDLDGNGYAIDGISFVNNSGNTIKNYKFNYGYFGAGHQLASPLKLISVVEDFNNSKKTHSFEYNDATNFPVLNDAVDHWGYVNGIVSPSVIIPNTIVSNGADREPSNLSLLGMLTKVTYPTRGETRFEYEPNLYFNGKNYQKNHRNAAVDLFRSNAYDNTLLTGENTFTLGYQQDVIVSFKRTPKEPTSTDPDAPNGPNAYTKNIEPEVTIIPLNGTPGATLKFSININADNNGVQQTVNLPPGIYELDVKCDSKELSVSGLVGYYEQTNIPIEGVKGPGQRIKSVSTYTNTSGQATLAGVKQYSYIDDLGFSTGVLLKGPNYVINDSYKIETKTNGPTTLDEYLIYGASITATLSDLLTQEMYYKQVFENEVSSNETLKSCNKFYSYLNSYNYTMTDIKLIEKTTYKKTLTGYAPLLKEEYKYGMQFDTTFSGIKPHQTLQINILPGGVGPERLRYFDWHWHALYPFVWVYDISNKKTSYTDTDSISVTTNYNNDFLKTHNLLSVDQVLSNGYTHITKFKYPESFTGEFIQPMIDHHVLSPIIEQQSWIKKSATESILTDAKIIEYDSTILKPKKEYVLESEAPVLSLDGELTNSEGNFTSLLSDSRFKSKKKYSYDTSNGNLVSEEVIGTMDGKQTNYIWGYNNNFPIAKCLNGANEDFFFTNFEDGGQGTVSGLSHTGQLYYAGDYSLNFSIPNSTRQYIYSYWYLLNGVWNFSGELPYNGPVSLTLGDGIDDVRVCPLGGQMSTYTYLQGVGLTSTTDAKNQTVYYDYDTSQRLIYLRDQKGNIIKNYKYNYKL